jgi:predicted HNH restriction endonuclease
LCANCHRMIHRTMPMECVEEFRNRLRPPYCTANRV